MVAFDMGASNFRAIAGTLEDGKLRVREIRREPNLPLERGGHYYFDIPFMQKALTEALHEAAKSLGTVDAVGVDTWGTTFGLLDREGNLLCEPYSYRDDFSDSADGEFRRVISRWELYQRVGGSAPVNSTMHMLLALRAKRPDIYERAHTYLMMPDLLTYLFSGAVGAEYTIQSSSRLIDARTRLWDYGLLDRFGIPRAWFPPTITYPGAIAGKLRPQIASLHPGLASTQVVTCAGHDTASAVATIPSAPGRAFISSGSWSVTGMVIGEPVVTARAYELGFENEGIADGRIRLLKNICGLWLLAECLRCWKKEGLPIDLKALDAEAARIPPFRSMVFPNYSGFSRYGGMPDKIRAFCRDTGQDIPRTPAEILAAINSGLAMEYRITMQDIAEVTGTAPRSLYIVGGGVKNRPLCQLAADATGLPVTTGYAEAGSAGNILMQAGGLGHLADLEEISAIAERSFGTHTYAPQHTEQWAGMQAHYTRLRIDPIQ